MAASGHFEFCALPRVAQTFKRGVAAYFVTNTLKYKKKAYPGVGHGIHDFAPTRCYIPTSLPQEQAAKSDMLSVVSIQVFSIV